MAEQHQIIRRGVFDADEYDRAFLTADYDRARDLLDAAPQTPNTILRLARLDLRVGKDVDALERLTALQPAEHRLRLERDVWLATAYSATADYQTALRIFDRVLEQIAPPDELYYAALFQKAHATWARRDLIALRALLGPLMSSPFPLYRGRGHLLLGWVHVGDGNLRRQADEYLRALDEFEGMAQPDMFVRLSTIFTLAALARELPLDDVAERVKHAYATLVPTSGMRVQYFKLTRVLGGIEALRGDELSAFRYYRAAAELAPNDRWRVLCMTDRAELARAAGERAFALDQLHAAHELASGISWNDASDEDRMALVNLAQLFAEEDAPIAQRYLAQFRSLTVPMNSRMALASDPRVQAFSAYAAGMALLQLGEIEDATGMLKDAWDLFERFGHGWRAALCAAGLYRATRESAWLSRANQQVKPWPNSWVAREVRRAPSRTRAENDESRVSPAQRPVLKLVLEGKRNAEIASTLARSPNTVRNHIAEIFKTFGVRSRSELIARLKTEKV